MSLTESQLKQGSLEKVLEDKCLKPSRDWAPHPAQEREFHNLGLIHSLIILLCGS